MKEDTWKTLAPALPLATVTELTGDAGLHTTLLTWRGWGGVTDSQDPPAPRALRVVWVPQTSEEQWVSGLLFLQISAKNLFCFNCFRKAEWDQVEV